MTPLSLGWAEPACGRLPWTNAANIGRPVHIAEEVSMSFHSHRRAPDIQAEGDYDGAKAILDRLAVIRPETQRVLDRLEDVPVDIEPRFVTAEELSGR